jgi:hypothetical protein
MENFLSTHVFRVFLFMNKCSCSGNRIGKARLCYVRETQAFNAQAIRVQILFSCIITDHNLKLHMGFKGHSPRSMSTSWSSWTKLQWHDAGIFALQNKLGCGRRCMDLQVGSLFWMKAEDLVLIRIDLMTLQRKGWFPLSNETIGQHKFTRAVHTQPVSLYPNKPSIKATLTFSISFWKLVVP